MKSSALVLFGHGARDPEWARPMQRVQAAIQARQPERPVHLAFLEFLTPSLEDCIDSLMAESATAGRLDVVVVPMFIAQGGHLKRDIPERIAVLRERFPGLNLTLADVLGEAPGVLEAIAEYAAQQ